MRQTFTSSHTLWTTTKTWLSTARSATCYTTTEKARLEGIYRGMRSGHGFSSGSYISVQERNVLLKAWTIMLVRWNQ
jgi:hypothetical protein